MNFDPSTLSPAARKQYEAGMAIYRAKVAGHHVPTAQEREAESIRRGNAEIVKKFGSSVALKKFGIASAKHVESPAEQLDRIAQVAADRAVKRFMAPPAKVSKAKPAPTKAKAPTPAKPAASTINRFSTVKRFSTTTFAGNRWSA